jgi:predicted nicotinamide N-methyase
MWQGTVPAVARHGAKAPAKQADELIHVHGPFGAFAHDSTLAHQVLARHGIRRPACALGLAACPTF